MTIFFPEFLGYNPLSTRFLIGIYYGILTTLPLAPSQLLSIRVLLLEENPPRKMVSVEPAKGIFIAGISGFLIAQFITFLSIYYSPLYELWFKPHIFNFILPPLLIWHYLKIIEFNPIPHLIPKNKYPLLDPKTRTIFLESFVLQIINPIVLPNPVFTRLLGIFLFQYSHIPIFCLGSIIGWLSGQFLFFKLSSILLSKLQSDSPSIYSIVKRIVHWVFPPIIMGIFLSYMGRVSMVPIEEKIELKKYTTLHYLWPNIFYNRDRLSRLTHFILSPNQSKLRNQTNVPFNTDDISLYKNHFSQFFFQKCLTDGKQRLLHNYPISLSIIEKDLVDLIKLNNINDDVLETKWNQTKKNRLFYFDKILNNQIYKLDQHIQNSVQKKINSINNKNIQIHYISQYIKKKNVHLNELSFNIRKYIYSLNFLNKRIRKSYDTRLDNSLRNQSKIIKNESFWFLNNKKDMILSPITNRSYLPRWRLNIQRLKRLKNLISKLDIYNNYFDLSKEVPIWKNQFTSSSLSYEFEFTKKNLTRTRRRKFFVRSFISGITAGRSQNINNYFFRFLEHKPRSSFFLQANQIIIDNKDHKDSIQHISQIQSEKFDFASSHSIRGPALIIQAMIRKYIRLPLLILGKSLIRLILFHSSEWEQDWAEWMKEKYVYCSYNGNYGSDSELPLHWLGDGLQIQIVSPVHITPWRPSGDNTSLVLKKNTPFTKSSYINIWGQETDVPFGQVQYTPFFKPILTSTILLIRNQTAQIIRIFYQIYFDIQKNYFIYINNFFVIKKKHSALNLKDSNHVYPTHMSYENNNFNKSFLNESTIIDSSIDQSLLSTKKIESIETNKKFVQKKKIISEQPDYPISNKIPKNVDLYKTKSNFINEQNSVFHSSIDSSNLFVKKNLVFNKSIIFPQYLILKKKKKFFTYQKLNLKMIFIHFIQKYIFIKKKITRIVKYVFFFIKQKKMKWIRQFIQFHIYIIDVLNKYILNIHQYLRHTFTKRFLIYSTTSSLFNLKFYANEHLLSHAYLLHKIWHSKIVNRLSIKKLLTEWNQEHPLQDHIKKILSKYGLTTYTSTNITFDSFQEWLKPFKRYRISPDIWTHIAPDLWRNQIRNIWEKNNNIVYNKSLHTTKHFFKESNQYLSYHKPFFERNQKIVKRWETILLMQNYINPLKGNSLYDILSVWQNENYYKNQFYFRDLIKNNTSFSNFNQKLNTFEKQPIYLKYNNTINLENFVSNNFKKRVVFKPIIQYRWKYEQDRLQVLNTIDNIQKAEANIENKLQNTTLITNKDSKSTINFIDKPQETMLNWKSLNLSPFTCQVIKKRQSKILDDEIIMHNLISSWLQFKKQYLYLKELKLFNISTHSSLLFQNNVTNQTFLLPEDLFLNQTLKEYRILSSLKLQLNNLSEKNEISVEQQKLLDQFCTNIISSSKNQDLYDYEIVKRYLWPSYRLEDLACFSRCLINTANQSRFSSLRIRIYPTFFV